MNQIERFAGHIPGGETMCQPAGAKRPDPAHQESLIDPETSPAHR